MPPRILTGSTKTDDGAPYKPRLDVLQVLSCSKTIYMVRIREPHFGDYRTPPTCTHTLSQTRKTLLLPNPLP